jgi:hypothetical protein
MDSDKPDIEEICFQVINSILGPHSTAYVSGSLETGRSYYESLAKNGTAEPHIRDKNQERLTNFVKELRFRLEYPVIDPGLLKISGWSGSNYDSFFKKVIGRYVKEVWFLDGWEYSSGSTKEFIYCISNKIRCLTQSGTELTSEAGKLLICQAVSYINKLGLESSKLSSRIQSLDNAIAIINISKNKLNNI